MKFVEETREGRGAPATVLIVAEWTSTGELALGEGATPPELPLGLRGGCKGAPLLFLSWF